MFLGDAKSIRRPGESRDPVPQLFIIARRWSHNSAYNQVRWLWVLASARMTHGVNTMAKQRSGSSRRTIIATIAGFSVTLFADAFPATASDKMTKPQAEYQDSPNGIYSCGLCTLFVAPDGCKVVEGAISKDGWCKAFAAVD